MIQTAAKPRYFKCGIGKRYLHGIYKLADDTQKEIQFSCYSKPEINEIGIQETHFYIQVDYIDIDNRHQNFTKMYIMETRKIFAFFYSLFSKESSTFLFTGCEEKCTEEKFNNDYVLKHII